MDKNTNHPWLRPIWSRGLLVAICVAIVLWDLYHGNYGWALIFGGMAGYAVYIFFIKWDPEDGEDEEEESEELEDDFDDDEDEGKG